MRLVHYAWAGVVQLTKKGAQLGAPPETLAMDADFRTPSYSEIQVEVFLTELTSTDRVEVTTPLNIFADDIKGQVRNFQEARHLAVSDLLTQRPSRTNTLPKKVDKEREYTNDPINMICMTIYKELSGTLFEG